MKKWYNFIEGSEKIKFIYEYEPDLKAVNLINFRIKTHLAAFRLDYSIMLKTKELPTSIPQKWKSMGADTLYFSLILFKLSDLKYSHFDIKNLEATSIEIEEISKDWLCWEQYDNNKQKFLSFYVQKIIISRLEVVNSKNLIKYDNPIFPWKGHVLTIENSMPLDFPYYLNHSVVSYFDIFQRSTTSIDASLSIDVYEPIDAVINIPEVATAHSHYFEFNEILIKTLNIKENNFANCTFMIKNIMFSNLYEIICTHYTGEIVFIFEATNVSLKSKAPYSFYRNPY